MKRIYSFVAAFALAASFSAQGSESFSNLTASASSYGSGSYTGDNGVTWTFSGARKVTSTDNVNGTSVGFNDTGVRTISANSGASGVGTITYTVRSYFTSGTGANRTIQVYVNGSMIDSYTLAAMATNYPRTATANISGDVTIEFRSTGSKQIVLDDVSWTQSSGSLSVNNLQGQKKSFVRNSLVNDEIIFGTDVKDVKVYNMIGQIVKNASVKENQPLHVDELQKGNYIVTGTVNNKIISQKIFKH